MVCEREKENSEIESASSTGCFSVESDFVVGIFVSAASIFPFVVFFHHRLRLSLFSCLRRSCIDLAREPPPPNHKPHSLPLATTPFNSRSTHSLPPAEWSSSILPSAPGTPLSISLAISRTRSSKPLSLARSLSSKAVVLNIPEMELKVDEATDNKPWGPSGTQMLELAKASHS